MSQQLNTELFTNVSEQDAAQVNGGNLGGFDWQSRVYAPIVGRIAPRIYYAVRGRIGNFERRLIATRGAGGLNNFYTNLARQIATGGIRL